MTAIAVIKQRQREARAHGDHQEFEDYLLIVDLSAPADQEPEFLAALLLMANRLHTWKAIVHLAEPALATLRESAAIGLHTEEFGGARLDNVREAYVVREWRSTTRALLANWPAATKIAFGDSIGIYLAPSFMTAEYRGLRRVKQQLQLVVRAAKGELALRVARLRRPSARPEKQVTVDRYYLSLPTAFDRVPSVPLHTTEMLLLRETMNELRPLLPASLLDALRRRLSGKKLVVLAGSNFSEQGAMSLEQEVAAYVRFLDEQSFDATSVVLIKPHPRDRRAKGELLSKALSASYADVLCLGDADSFYVPLEVLLLELQDRQTCESIDICTFSSACLAAKYILNIDPKIGFGAQIVSGHWNPSTVEPRLRHEAQLRQACEVSSSAIG